MIKASKHNAVTTSLFANNLNNLSGMAKNNPSYPLVIKSRNARDYEPIFSLGRYFVFMGIQNPVYLDYANINLGDGNNLEKILSEELMQISNGGTLKENMLFHPFDPNKIGRDCIQISLGTEDNGHCVFEIGF
jgi:hypothetical protein